jgi:phosphatidylglycerol:prolipoprotein diacylglycerol transferase
LLVELNPIAFQIGPFTVYWYGIFMALSFLFAAWYLCREARQKGLDEDFLLNLCILAIIAGVAGARLFFVLVNYPQWFIHDPLQILKTYQGGLAWHGGLLGGVLASWWYCRRKRISIHFLLDLGVPGVALGYFMIRIANIFNQEVLGRPTDFWFDRWPAQLIGAAIGLSLFLRYFYLKRKKLPEGYQFWSFIFYHQLFRGMVEETMREMPLALAGYIVPHWGLGFFTLGQLGTPFIMAFAYWMMRQSYIKWRRKFKLA